MSRVSDTLIVLLLVASCDVENKQQRDIPGEIDALLTTGEFAGAEQLCKTAIRDNPSDPTLRMLYGDVFLGAKNGRNAEIAFEKAIELGTDRATLQTRLARALLLQEKYLDVLDLDYLDAALGEPENLEMAVLRLGAASALPGSNDKEIRRQSQALVNSLDRHRGEPWAIALQAELETLRKNSPAVAAGLVHARCGPESVVDYTKTRDPAVAETRREVLRVGPTQSIRTPSEAARVAVDGTTVLIDAADYSGDVALWRQDNLTIIGVNGRPHIRAAGRGVEGRDIWLFKGDNVVVENVEFSGARSEKSLNGAGIRHTGNGLTVRHSFFHDSDNGILTWKSPERAIVIEYSEFARNGFGDGQSHNVYVGASKSLTFRSNYSHAAKEGHLLKTRAKLNDIRYNRLSGEAGQVSYVIDIPNGGVAYVVGNVIEKAVDSRNPYVISFGQEGLTSDENRLFVVNNSVYNRYDKTIFVRNASESPAFIANNLVGGLAVGLVTGKYEGEGNRLLPEHGMVSPREYDFALTGAAGAIDSGVDLRGFESELPLVPIAEYVHPVSMRPRSSVAQIDAGAHEFCGELAPSL